MRNGLRGRGYAVLEAGERYPSVRRYLYSLQAPISPLVTSVLAGLEAENRVCVLFVAVYVNVLHKVGHNLCSFSLDQSFYGS